MNIPVDGVLIKGSGVQCDESAITGESIEIKKEVLEICLAKVDELNSEKNTRQGERTSHDVPSPVILSGT